MKTKKVWIFIVALFFILPAVAVLLNPPSAKAQDSGGVINSIFGFSNEAEVENKAKLVEDSVEGLENPNRTDTAARTTEDMYRVTTLHIGGLPEEITAGLTEEEKKIAYQIYGNGAIGDMGRYVALLYTPPASAQTYLADLFYNAKIIPEAHAQGVGFASLDPILESWKIFRNVAYLFFVFVFLVVGFLIMFQHKINGQTVVTAQQAIPNIIVSMIFVTFSYAIAGLLIDLMYVFMYFMISLFNESGELLNLNIFGLAARLIHVGLKESFSTVNQAVKDIIGVAVLKQIVGSASGLIVSLIVALGILFSIFKVFLHLLKSYVLVVTQVAFAPLLLMFGAIPGKNVFGSWIKQIVGNLAAFPVVLLLLLMSQLMTSYEIQTGGWMPPFMLGQGLGAVMPTIIGIGILMIIPEIIDQVKKAMGVTEGIFGELTKAAKGSALRGVDYGVPTAMTARGAARGGAKGLAASWAGGTRDWRELWRDARDGYTGELDGETVTVGGWAREGKAAMDRGMNLRRRIDQVAEGRVFEAEDLQKSLTKLAQQSRGEEEKPPSPTQTRTQDID